MSGNEDERRASNDTPEATIRNTAERRSVTEALRIASAAPSSWPQCLAGINDLAEAAAIWAAIPSDVQRPIVYWLARYRECLAAQGLYDHVLGCNAAIELLGADASPGRTDG